MNSKRGGVTLLVDGTNYDVRVTTNAMVRYQDHSGESFLDGIAALQTSQSDVRRMRNLFWAGVSHIEDMTPEKAGDLMDEVGFAVALEKVSEAAALAFPQPSDGDAVGNGRAAKAAKPKKPTT
ncbi:hypothetical protein SAMN04488005_1507 [Yoonia tamlensis]|uniref:Phage tail tube protein, GTA-gp10 n=1 Tax=Yoonia tamlensis TaxID=390270 RepID=A0A1I6GEA3_9RHOB|nr:hypothetical protein [Yoonia tamlensis]SFR40488.1 hypothetical protein SAMN04488005_1507 [Yoonia tamlensis]